MSVLPQGGYPHCAASFASLLNCSLQALRSSARSALGNHGANRFPLNGPTIVSRKTVSPDSGMIVCQAGLRRRSTRAPADWLSADKTKGRMSLPSSEKVITPNWPDSAKNDFPDLKLICG